jgi:DNA-binding transcriptional MerR regulator
MEDGNQNPYLPVYNIKAIARLVGLQPVTLRAWERRYGLPVPHRGEQGYRYYSDYDLRTLRWIKSQVDQGLNISRVVEVLNELRATGKDPAESAPVPVIPAAVSIPALSEQFQAALVHFDETLASHTLRRAFTIYAVDTVLLEIVQPTLVALGEAWHAGQLPIVVEHFATQYCMQHLNSLLATSAAPTRTGVIVAACAPGENHQIGLMSLVVMLRWRGWDMKYLGPDLKLDRMEEALIPLQPKIILFSATLPQNAQHLEELAQVLERFPEPKPLIILGGQAFETFRLSSTLPVVYLSQPPSAVVEAIETLMVKHTASESPRKAIASKLPFHPQE